MRRGSWTVVIDDSSKVAVGWAEVKSMVLRYVASTTRLMFGSMFGDCRELESQLEMQRWVQEDRCRGR
jgi:hypothetical protein